MQKCYFDSNPPLDTIKEAMNLWRANFLDANEDQFSFDATFFVSPAMDYREFGSPDDLDAFWQARFSRSRWQVVYSRNENADCFRIDGERGYCFLSVCLVHHERELAVIEPFERWAAGHFFDKAGIPRRPRIILGHGAGKDWHLLSDHLSSEFEDSKADIVPMDAHNRHAKLSAGTVMQEGIHDRTVAVFYVSEADLMEPEAVVSLGYSLLLLDQALGAERVLLVVDSPAKKRLGQRFAWLAHIIECNPRGGVVLRAKQIVEWISSRAGRE